MAVLLTLLRVIVALTIIAARVVVELGLRVLPITACLALATTALHIPMVLLAVHETWTGRGHSRWVVGRKGRMRG